MQKNEYAKKIAGEKAAFFIEPGMRVGLGTGSTVKFFLEALGKRCQEGLQIEGFPTSFRTEALAKEHGIPLGQSFTELDLTVDGADAVTDDLQLIKGRGGALLREKIIAFASKKIIVIVDDSKLVKDFGGESLPLEVLPFGLEATIYALEKMGHSVLLRKDPTGEIFLSDNGNYTLDLTLLSGTDTLKRLDHDLRKIPGVLETGLFLGLATEVLVGSTEGKVKALAGQV